MTDIETSELREAFINICHLLVRYMIMRDRQQLQVMLFSIPDWSQLVKINIEFFTRLWDILDSGDIVIYEIEDF